jgi:hypothetical protein
LDLLTCLEIGLNFSVDGATETIKSIHALHRFNNTGTAPYTLVVGDAEYLRPSRLSFQGFSHGCLLSSIMMGDVVNDAMEPFIGFRGAFCLYEEHKPGQFDGWT